MQGWKEKFLSHAGKEILLKVVVQAIPTYTMSVFKISKTLCNDINSTMDELGKDGKGKDGRGLGFRDLECFNTTLLAKQGWRLLQNLDSLVLQF
jgi:hypothetical protein